jgi:hypothetical protein
VEQDDRARLVASRLLVLIGSRLGLLLGGIPIPFSARRALVGFVQIAPSLGMTLLAVAYRPGHQQGHEHDGDNDDDHTFADREHSEKGGTQSRAAASAMERFCGPSPAFQPFSDSVLVTALRVRVVRVVAEERGCETNDNGEQHEDQEPPLPDPDQPLVHTPGVNLCP